MLSPKYHKLIHWCKVSIHAKQTVEEENRDHTVDQIMDVEANNNLQ